MRIDARRAVSNAGALGLAIVVLLVWFLWPRPVTRLVKVAVIGPLTGPAAPYGRSQQRGAELAAAEINAGGGLAGRLLELVVLDDGSHPVRAAELAIEAIYRRRVVAIVGSVDSEATMMIQPWCERAGVPLLNAASTHPGISRTDFRFTWRLPADDQAQADLLAGYTARRRWLERVGLLAVDSRYGREGARCYVAAAARMGQQIVASATFAEGATNFAPQIAAVLQAAPDALVIWGTWRDAALLIRQLREERVTLPVFGGDGLTLPAFLRVVGSAGEGVIAAAQADLLVNDRAGEAFVVAFRRRFQVEPDSFAALAHRQLHHLARVWRRFPPDRDPSGADLIAAIAGGETSDRAVAPAGLAGDANPRGSTPALGVLGDDEAMVGRPPVLVRVRSGAFVPVGDPVEPPR